MALVDRAGRRPVLVVARDLCLEQADTLAIVLRATTTDRGCPNHVRLRGEHLDLPEATFAMTEQPQTVTRDRFAVQIGVVDSATMREVDRWLRDFLALP